MDALVQGLLKGVTAEGFEDCFKAKVCAARTSLGSRNQIVVLVHIGGQSPVNWPHRNARKAAADGSLPQHRRTCRPPDAF